MIITRDIFPVTIAHTNWADKHLLGDDFDIEVAHYLNQSVSDARKLQPTIESTFRFTNDVMGMESVKPFRYWMESIMDDLWAGIGYEPAEIAIERSWINRVPKGAHLFGHAHGSTEMVCTYYHKAPTGSAKLILHNPFEMQSGMSPYANKTIEIQPKDGDLYAWPGYLWHSVETHETDEPRIAISMHVHQGSYTLSNRWVKAE